MANVEKGVDMGKIKRTLSKEEITTVWRMMRAGLSIAQIAHRFGVNKPSIKKSLIKFGSAPVEQFAIDSNASPVTIEPHTFGVGKIDPYARKT